METTELQQKTKIEYFNEYDLALKKQGLIKTSFQGLFKYPDGTHSIVHEKNIVPEIGQIVSTYNFQLMIITEIIGTRPHQGVYNDESKRQNVSIVNVEPLVFEQLRS